MLLSRRSTASMLVCIAAFGFAGLVILIGTKFTQDLFKDSSEAYGWGREFLGGYGRHPPLTGWVAGMWYSVFPASNWASYLLSRVLVCVALATIYLLARRVLDTRRAALVAFAMMLYPLFVGAKSDRFGTYQMLLPLVPVLILTFLVAYERCTARAGALLGLVGAAGALAVYSAALPLFAVALAAILHPGRTRFFASPAPYVALAVFAVALSPHVVWLISSDFPSFRWAAEQLIKGAALDSALKLGVHQLGLVAIPLVAGALVLLPWRLRRSEPRVASKSDAALVLIIAAVLMLSLPTLGLLLNLRLKLEWGDPLFFLVPIVVLLLARRLTVTRRAVTRIATIAGIVTVLHMAGAPLYALNTFKTRPDYDVYTPLSELAGEVTRMWRDQFHSPLPIVIAQFEIAAPVGFYSPDHPRMPPLFAAAQPERWIAYPPDLWQHGFVGICYLGDDTCSDTLHALAPDARSAEVTLARTRAGIKAKSATFHIVLVPPRASK